MQTLPNGWESQVGLRLREFRKAAGLDEAQFAKKIGQDEATVKLTETGQRSVSAKELWEICAVLNLKPYQVFEDDT